MRVAQVCVAAALVAVIAGQGYLEGDSYKQFDPVEDYGLDPHSSTWKFTASKGIVTGGYGPEPFCYDGDSSCFYAVDATAQVELDTVDNVGSIFIEFDITDYDLTNHTQANETFTNGILPIITQAPGELMGMTGRFRLEYTVFKGSASAPFKEGGVADNVIMHGHDPSVEDAFNGAAEFPLCSAFVASWGPVNVMFRATGENEFTPLFPNNIQEGRPPGIIGHTMLTEQFYFENKVYKNNGRLQGEECPFTDYYNGWGDQNQTDFGQGCASETKAPNEYHVNVKADGAGTDLDGAIGIFPFWMHIYFPEIEDNSELIVDQSGLNPIWYAAIGLGVLALAGAAFVLTKKSEASGAIELKDKV